MHVISSDKIPKWGDCKTRNETETKRAETKRSETKRDTTETKQQQKSSISIICFLFTRSRQTMLDFFSKDISSQPLVVEHRHRYRVKRNFQW